VQPIGSPLDDLSLGVLGYVASRLCAADDTGLRVAALLEDADACAASLGQEPVLCLPIQLQVGDLPYGSLRLWVPERTAKRLALRPRGATPPGDVDASVSVVACAVITQTTLSLGALRALSPGDVLVPERCAFRLTDEGWSGPAEVRVHGVASRLRATAHDQELVIERSEPRQEPEMTEAKRIKTAAMMATEPAPLGEDTPIEMCLELARFTLPLGELTTLQPGDVLDTGRAVGSHVTLSAAGRAVAIGELVVVDGDVGLRVLERRRGAATER
jgi:type III secretion system YscQ/HrcQ family protein